LIGRFLKKFNVNTLTSSLISIAISAAEILTMESNTYVNHDQKTCEGQIRHCSFYTFGLLLFSTLNVIFGTTGFVTSAFKSISEISFSSGRTVQAENRPAFDVSKGGDRFFVLNHMHSVANQRCTIKVMQQNQLNQPGSPCQSYGDYLIYTKYDGDRQIIFGQINGRSIDSKVVIVPNEWHNGEWRVASVPGFDWAEASRILAAGNAR
jgi:hypothetical protein